MRALLTGPIEMEIKQSRVAILIDERLTSVKRCWVIPLSEGCLGLGGNTVQIIRSIGGVHFPNNLDDGVVLQIGQK